MFTPYTCSGMEIMKTIQMMKVRILRMRTKAVIRVPIIRRVDSLPPIRNPTGKKITTLQHIKKKIVTKP